MAQTKDIPTAILDRRVAARVDFGARVSVCEYPQDKKLPPQQQFRPVKGSNLSQAGISFLTTDWPTSDSLIVSFGDEDPAQVVARIVNIRPESKGPEMRRFEVSCEFSEWLGGV